MRNIYMCTIQVHTHTAFCLPRQEGMQTAWSTVEVQCRLHDLVDTSCLSCLLLFRWLFEHQPVLAGAHAEGDTYKKKTVKELIYHSQQNFALF